MILQHGEEEEEWVVESENPKNAPSLFVLREYKFPNLI